MGMVSDPRPPDHQVCMHLTEYRAWQHKRYTYSLKFTKMKKHIPVKGGNTAPKIVEIKSCLPSIFTHIHYHILNIWSSFVLSLTMSFKRVVLSNQLSREQMRRSSFSGKANTFLSVTSLPDYSFPLIV